VVQGEVLVEAAQHHREVLLLLASLPMSVSKQPLAGASEELSAALGAGDPDQGETPCSIRPTDVLEPSSPLRRISGPIDFRQPQPLRSHLFEDDARLAIRRNLCQLKAMGSEGDVLLSFVD
jgi:hypothetical protein